MVASSILHIAFLVISKLSLVDGKQALRSTASLESNRRLSSDASDFESTANECFSSIDEEFMTTRDWWNNTRLPSPFPDAYGNRSHWITKRGPGQPIVGDDTMIAGVLYTFDEGSLKMNILFPPLYPQENRNVVVYILVADNIGSFGWQGASTNCEVQEDTWYCPVRVSGLDTTRAYRYDIQYYPDPINSPRLLYYYSGSIPVQKSMPRIAALSCFGMDDTNDKTALVEAVLDAEPDLLVLQGDQTYMHDALGYGFLELVHSINNITRSIPTLVQMDDHDYGEPNLWGAAAATSMSGQGFHKPVCVVNAMQKLYMSHMPDPISNKTLDNGIEIYYTSYRYGSVDFAVLESRKFKSEEEYGSLLGADQEAWLESWCSIGDSALRIVLTQTPFAALGTNVTSPISPYGLVPATNSRDPNGFPVEGRNRFMNIAKGCSPLVLSGDQHLGLAVAYDDFGISECTSPAAINDVFWRLNTGAALNSTQSDSWGNQYRLLNVWNVDGAVHGNYAIPSYTRFAGDSVKAGRAEGFLIVDLNGTTATCEMHGYRRGPEIIWSVDVPAQAR